MEFALILPVFLGLVVGMFSGGIAYNRKISITSAVREGARYGATLACSASCVSGSSPTLSAQIKARVADASGGELSAADVCAAVSVAPDPPPLECGVPDPAGSAGTRIIKVSASKPAQIDVVAFRIQLTLSSKNAARYERDSTYGQ